ncbi:X-ray radiation resistance-associated protein 1 [Heterodontus francisci]|uniref:X-ray radiation resistance-associated protein 1 n=1 Tax=Heterodontus francisci TaxID=7792 RepID=UPI00355BD065
MCFLKQKNEFFPPFSGLTHLSLAQNKISDDEELLAVCLFPALSKLTIYNNPVVFHSGKPLLVLSMLEDRLGIEVIRSKPQLPEKPPVGKVFNRKRKVDIHIPRIPKQVLMLETAEQLLGLNQAGEGETQCEAAELETAAPSDICTELMSPLHMACSLQDRASEGTSWTWDGQLEEAVKEKEVEGFFMTQVDDGTLKREDEETVEERQTESTSVTTNLPDKYGGYEELLNAKTDPYFVEPIGIQQNVQQLERSLRKLQLYPDPFAKVNLQQEPYVSKERKLRKLAEFTSHKSKADKMEEILKRMKEQRAMTIIPLAHVLRDKGVSKQEYVEAVHLLRELQLKYKEAHKRLAANVNRLYSECEEFGSEMQLSKVSPENPANQPGQSTSQE